MWSSEPDTIHCLKTCTLITWCNKWLGLISRHGTTLHQVSQRSHFRGARRYMWAMVYWDINIVYTYTSQTQIANNPGNLGVKFEMMIHVYKDSFIGHNLKNYISDLVALSAQEQIQFNLSCSYNHTMLIALIRCYKWLVYHLYTC